jgi:hypothetical protein
MSSSSQIANQTPQHGQCIGSMKREYQAIHHNAAIAAATKAPANAEPPTVMLLALLGAAVTG